MLKLLALTALFFSTSALAKDISLTVAEFDTFRERVSINLLDATQVPLGTDLRIHSKTGTCKVTIVERVNNQLIGKTNNCDTSSIQPGMNLAFSDTNNDWQPTARTEYRRNISTDFETLIKDRISVHVGYNFSNQLEGKVIADGSVKNLEGDSAFSLGARGRIYDLNPIFSLAAEISYETPRTFDRATFTNTAGQRILGVGSSPRLSLWTFTSQLEARPMDKLVAFGGLNYSLPSLTRSPYRMTGDIGFQLGGSYEVYERVAVEGLVKITNMNFKNDIGETTDVSLAGIEVRGRYNF